MTYIYTYKSQDYNSYYDVTHLPDFKNICFPRKEVECKEAALNAVGITRREYVAPVPSLSEVKERKKKELTRYRDREEDENVTTDKGDFEFDSLSRTRLSNAMNAMTDTDSRSWTCADGLVVEMTKSDFLTIFATAATRSDEAYDKLNRLKTDVDNCTSIDDVNAITWDED